MPPVTPTHRRATAIPTTPAPPQQFLLTWEWPGDSYGFNVYRLNLADRALAVLTSTTNLQCVVSNTLPSAFFTVQDWRWLTWDKNLEGDAAGYVLSCSLTNAMPTNMVMLRSVNLLTNAASMNLLFSGLKSGPYKVWVQARNSEGLLGSLCDDCFLNVFWRAEPIKMNFTSSTMVLQ